MDARANRTLRYLYDEKAEKLLPRMAHYLEGCLARRGDKYHVHVKERIRSSSFPNHIFLKKNNIVPVGEGTGGVTEAFKKIACSFLTMVRNVAEDVIYHDSPPLCNSMCFMVILEVGASC